jgi:glycosyltransferase involved in cell wall biosynthesis
MISFVVPAHNEEGVLGETLRVLFGSARALGEAFEVIVVDDASTDRTGEIARQMGARVERVELRQISAVRNAGARAALGEILVFVDADTLVGEATLRAAWAALADGAIGGGAKVKLDREAPLWGKLATWMIAQIWFRLRWAAGCFMFVRRDAFKKVGGFDEMYFLGEEMYLSKALKREGKFVIVGEAVVTSARKFRTYTAGEMLGAIVSLLGKGPASWKQRENARWWYEGRRERSLSVKDAPGETGG